jgi:hypothetical protein
VAGRPATSSDSITSAGDEFDTGADNVKALRTDPDAVRLLGEIDRTAAFGYSASGIRLRGLLRHPAGKGLFDFSLVGGTGNPQVGATPDTPGHQFETRSVPR